MGWESLDHDDDSGIGYRPINVDENLYPNLRKYPNVGMSKDPIQKPNQNGDMEMATRDSLHSELLGINMHVARNKRLDWDLRLKAAENARKLLLDMPGTMPPSGK